MLSHPGLSEFHLEPTTAPVAALFLNCPSTMRPGHPTEYLSGHHSQQSSATIDVVLAKGYKTMNWLLWMFAIVGFATTVDGEARIKRMEKRLSELENQR